MFKFYALYFLSLAAWVWLIIRSWRTSPLLAIGTFLFFPIAIITLIKSWGHPNRDIRVPLGATFGLTVLLGLSSLSLVAELEEEYGEYDDLAEFEVEPLSDLQSRILRQQLIGRLQLRTGEVELEPLPATLNIPDRFRYVDQDQLVELAQALGWETVDSLGLMVHESVNLLDEEGGWVIWIDWKPAGYIPWGDPEKVSLERLDAETAFHAEQVAESDYANGYDPYQFDEFAVDPVFDRDGNLITWAENITYRDSGDKLIDCYAAVPARKGFMLFVAGDMPRSHEELCFRSVRYAASNLTFADGHRLEDAGFFDRESEFQLVDLVTGNAH